jgi:hypothetical protein
MKFISTYAKSRFNNLVGLSERVCINDWSKLVNSAVPVILRYETVNHQDNVALTIDEVRYFIINLSQHFPKDNIWATDKMAPMEALIVNAVNYFVCIFSLVQRFRKVMF